MPDRVDKSKAPWSKWESDFKRLLYNHVGSEIDQIYQIGTRDHIHELYNIGYDPQKAFDHFILHGMPKTDVIFKY